MFLHIWTQCVHVCNAAVFNLRMEVSQLTTCQLTKLAAVHSQQSRYRVSAFHVVPMCLVGHWGCNVWVGTSKTTTIGAICIVVEHVIQTVQGCFMYASCVAAGTTTSQQYLVEAAVLWPLLHAFAALVLSAAYTKCMHWALLINMAHSKSRVRCSCWCLVSVAWFDAISWPVTICHN